MRLESSPLVTMLAEMEKSSILARDLEGRTLGSVRGTVTDVKDPKNLGRVRVLFDGFAKGDNSHWVDVEGPFSGQQPTNLVGSRVTINPSYSDLNRAIVSSVILESSSEQSDRSISSLMLRAPVYGAKGNLPPPNKTNHGCIIIQDRYPKAGDKMLVCLRDWNGSYIWHELATLEKPKGGLFGGGFGGFLGGLFSSGFIGTAALAFATGGIGAILPALGGAIPGLAGGLGGIASAVGGLVPGLGGVIGTISSAVPGLGGILSSVGSMLPGGLGGILSSVTSILPAGLTDIFSGISSFLPSGGLGGILGNIIPGFGGILEGIIPDLGGLITGGIDGLVGQLGEITGIGNIREIIDMVTGSFGLPGISDLGGIITSLPGISDIIGVTDLVRGLEDEIISGISSLALDIGVDLESILKMFSDEGDLPSFLESTLQGIVGADVAPILDGWFSGGIDSGADYD